MAKTGLTGAAGIALVCALSGGLWPACAAPATDAVIAEAQAALDNGDAAHARRLTDGALDEGGASALQRGRLLLDRGLAQELLGASQDAMADFTAALDTDALPPPERAQALLQRGFLLDGMNRLDDAAGDYSAVIRLKAGAVPMALNNRANIYRRQNRLADARRDYLASLAAGNDKAQFPYYGLGQIAEAGGDSQAARGLYAKAVAADPGYGLAAERLASLGGPPDAAIASSGDGIVLHPPGPAAIVLHRPAQDDPQRVILHPPRPRNEITPAGYHPGRKGPGLRPALDAPVAPQASGPSVQLGAWRSEAEASQGWNRAVSRAGGALDGMTPHIVTADLPGKGRYYRLRAGASGSPASLCAALTAKGIDCLPVRD